MRLRQVSLMTSSLRQAELDVMNQLGVTIVNRDRVHVAGDPDVEGPPMGLKNAVFAIGDTFLEILQPVLPDVTGQRFLDQRGGDAGYMACLHVEDMDKEVKRVTELGVRIVLALDAFSYNEAEISSAHLHPADTGGTFFSFEQAITPGSWAWAGLAWEYHRYEDVVQSIVGIVISTPDPAKLAARLTEVLDAAADGLVLHLSGGGTITLVHDAQAIRDQMTAVELQATDRTRVGEEFLIAGTVLRLV